MIKNRAGWQTATVISVVLLAVLLLISLTTCSRSSPVTHNANGAQPLIAVSIPPQEWFVEKVSGGRARTLVLAGQGQNPHSYEPSPKQISSLAEVGAWILSGSEFEISLLPKVRRLFPRLSIVDGTEGVRFRSMEAHDDEDGGEHSPLEIDRHTWLGCAPAKILAAHIRDTLSGIDPGGAAHYAENCRQLTAEIDNEFEHLRRELAPLRGRNIFVYHPAFGYFLDEFGIGQEAVETGGKEPGPRDLSRLIALAKQEQPAAIFVQAQFPANAAGTVAKAVGAELVSLDPLARDYLANIRLMGEALQRAVDR